MTTQNTDSNLLFGILALQMDFVDRNAMIEAMHAWVLEKSRPIGDILVERNLLSTDRYKLLQALVEEHVKQHSDDPQKSLASLSAAGAWRDDLAVIQDRDVQASLVHVGAKQPDGGFYSAATLSVGSSTSAGERFRILRPHAKGGLGQVSVAEDVELHREVALKEIQPEYADSDESRTRFLLEAEVTGALEHPGIVPVYGLGQYANGRPFYAMRFVRGDSLHDAIRRFYDGERGPPALQERRLELHKLLGRVIDVCQAIHYAHTRGVLHRDLKPGNIMLGKYGETLVVDWGLAKTFGDSAQKSDAGESLVHPSSAGGSMPTQMGSAVGTPAYMSPEQAAGKVDQLGRASDIYSLGATLFHVLTGRSPLEGQDIGRLLQQVQHGEIPRPRQVNPSVPVALEAICMKAMALDPKDRYASAQQLAEDLEHWLADEPVAAHPESRIQRIGRWTRRHRSWTQAGATAVVLVAVVAAVAAGLVLRAQKQETAAWALTAKTREFDMNLLEQKELDENSLAEFERLAEDIARLSNESAEVLLTQLYDKYAATLRRALDVPRFDDEERTRFDERLRALEIRSSDHSSVAGLLQQLRTQRDDRLRQWDFLFDLKAPFETSVHTVFGPDQIHTSGAQSLRRIADSGERYRLIRTSERCPPGNIELRATFGRTWSNASLLGLALNASDEHHYEFLLTVPQFDYRDRTEEELSKLPAASAIIAKSVNNRLEMYILRDGQPLRRKLVRVDGEGTLQLYVRREGGTLRLTVNDQHTIRFEDPFPLPANQPGTFGILWPSNVDLEMLQGMRLRVPRRPSPIENGDELYATGQFSDALRSYRSLETVEAQYKAALCQYELGSGREFVTALEQLVAQPPGTERSEDDPWRLRAMCRLLRQRVEQKRWDDVRLLLKDLADYYQRDEVVLLVPATYNELILQQFRRPGLRARTNARTSSAIEDLKWSLRVQELFNEDTTERRMTKWRLADAYRWNGERQQAMAIVRELIDGETEGEAPTDSERIALVSDLVWMLILENDLPTALDEVNRWLLDDSRKDRRNLLPLLVSRACIWIKSDEPTKAAQDLDRFFREVPVTETDHAQFARAALIRGMLYQRDGDEASAQDIWRRALRRNWHAGYLDPLQMSQRLGLELVHDYDSRILDGILMSWTNELTPEEAVLAYHNFMPGSGVMSTSLRRLADATFEPEYIREVLLRLYQSSRGREFGRRYVLYQWSLTEPSGMQLVLAEGIRVACLKDVEVTPDLEQLLFDSCRQVMEAWYERGDDTFGEAGMRQVLNLWRGKFSRRDFNAIANTLQEIDKQMFASGCFVLGNKYALEGGTPVAEFLLQQAVASEDAHPLVRELARDQLFKLLSGPMTTPSSANRVQ